MNRKQEDSNGHNTSIGLFQKLFLLAGEGKIQPVFDYLEDMLAYPKKFVVFCHHKVVMEGLQQRLDVLQEKEKRAEKDPIYVKIDGSSSSSAREYSVKTFQTPLTPDQKITGKGGTRIILLSITAASTGLTLTQSSTVIFAEMYWTPATLRQAEDRVHRIGQENSVNIIYLMGKGTIDERIFTKVQEKFHTVSNALDGINAQRFDAEASNSLHDALSVQTKLDFSKLGGGVSKKATKISLEEENEFDKLLEEFEKDHPEILTNSRLDNKEVIDQEPVTVEKSKKKDNFLLAISEIKSQFECSVKKGLRVAQDESALGQKKDDQALDDIIGDSLLSSDKKNMKRDICDESFEDSRHIKLIHSNEGKIIYSDRNLN